MYVISVMGTETTMGSRVINAGCLATFRDWTGGRELVTLGSNAGSDPLPFQSWRNFKEAFAPEIVERAVRETPGIVRHIADPFGGSGTSALAAQFLGIRPTTIEVNPFLADLIEAKLAFYDLKEATTALGTVVELVATASALKNPVFTGAPKTFVEPGVNGRYIFSKPIARRLLAYRYAIEKITDQNIRRLFRVILGSVTIPVSNVITSGKGRRYRGGWAQRSVDETVVDQLFMQGVLAALYDIRRFETRPCRDYRIMRGDARRLVSMVGPCDLAIFSPPYPNSFDYTDVYNIELWTLGYLDGPEANSRLRKSTLRSHVQILRDMNANEYISPTLTETVRELRKERKHLWNRHIEDIGKVMAGLASNLRARGRVYMVVGDSRYAGINVSVAAILAEVAPSFGYSLCNVEPFRSMRASPQQGGRLGLSETLVVLERS